MEKSEVVALLLSKLSEPTEVLYAFTMQDLIAAIVGRIGEKAAELAECDLLQARDEVQAALFHYMDEREFVGIGLDAWEVISGA